MEVSSLRRNFVEHPSNKWGMIDEDSDSLPPAEAATRLPIEDRGVRLQLTHTKIEKTNQQSQRIIPNHLLISKIASERLFTPNNVQALTNPSIKSFHRFLLDLTLDTNSS